jgi:hypothetical protein
MRRAKEQNHYCYSNRVSYPVSSIKTCNVRLEVLKIVTMLVLSTFRRIYHLHQAQTFSLSPASSGFLLGIFIHSEDGGEVLSKRRSLVEIRGVGGQRVVSFETYNVIQSVYHKIALPLQ